MSAGGTIARLRLRMGGATGADPESLIGRLPALVAGWTALAVIVWLAWHAGGYFPDSFLVAGTAAFAVLAVILVVRPPQDSLSTPAVVGLGSLIALVLWTALASWWSPSPGVALDLVQRDLTHVGLFGLGLIAASGGRFVRPLVWGLLTVVVLVIAAGVFARLFPLIVGGDAEASFGGYRLDYPLSYWNAYGGVAAFGIVLALGLGADADSSARSRALTAAGATVMGLGLYLSFSRSAWLTLIVGFLVLLALGPLRWRLLLCGLPTLLAAGLAIILVQQHPELVDARAGVAHQADAGMAFAPVLGLLVLAAAALQFVMPAGGLSDHTRAWLRRRAAPLAPPAAAAAVIGVIVIGALGGLGSVERVASRQWQDFMRASTPTGIVDPRRGPVGVGLFPGRGNARLISAKGTRSEVYRVALAEFSAHPVFGSGAGSFEYTWYRGRRLAEDTRNAHSLYLETLAELGIVGGLLLLGFLGSLAAAALRARARPGALRAAQISAVTAAVSVWLVHAAVDWDWQISAFTAMALVLAAVVYAEGGRAHDPRAS